MAQWLGYFDSFGPLLARASWQAAAVAVVVLLISVTLQDRIAPRWRFALWALVLVRMMLPAIPPSPASMFQVFRWQPTAYQPREQSTASHTLFVAMDSLSLPPDDQQVPSEARLRTRPDVVSSQPGLFPESPTSAFPLQRSAIRWTGWKIAGLVWIGGIIVLASRLGLQVYSLDCRRRSWRPVDYPNLLSTLSHCRRQLGVRARIDLCIGPHETSPAVTGVWRPRIVIPENLLTTLTGEQWELVLLHELAHIRRSDILVHWLLITVRLVYWFNPVVWLAVRRMQAERELACDELVLDAIGAPRSRSYGDTLLEIVRGSVEPMRAPRLIGAIGTFGRLHRRIAMIRDYRKRSWQGTLVATAVLAGVATSGLTDSPPASQGEEPQTAPQGDSQATGDQTPAAAKTPYDSPVRKLLDQIKEERRPDFGASILRDLVKLGPDAVPELTRELDATQSQNQLRSLGFVLRAIGDNRAVPALIRAIPKTCLKPSSDYGSKVDDPELMEFMRKHDKDEEDRHPDRFTFGRPVMEISFALRKLTGQKLGEDELLFVMLNGSDRQQRIQRQLYQRVAQRWADWWEANWQDHVEDDAYSKVNLDVRKDLANQIAFPHGPTAVFAEPMDGVILQSVHAPDAEAVAPLGKIVFLDLDTNRFCDLPARLRSAQGEPERMDEISTWAAREGFDVMGTEHTPAGEDKPHYVIRALGLTAWQIKTELWATILEELSKPEPPTLESPAAGLLAHFDEGTGQYDPQQFATFLFVTREGGYGALFVGAEVTSTAVEFGKPADGPRIVERSNVGVYKGRRLSYRLVEEPAK